MSQTIKGWLVASASALACASVTACALAPERIPTASVMELCDYYSKQLSPNFLDPEIKAELIRRGAADCTDPALIQARINASTAMFQQGMSMMAAGQAGESFATYVSPKTDSYVSPAPGNITAFKSGEVTSGMTKQCFYSFGANRYTRTIGSTALCPLSIKVQ